MLIQVDPAREEHGILARPPPGLGIIIPCAQADKLRVAVIQPAGKAKGLEARVGVEEDITILPLAADSSIFARPGKSARGG